MTDHNVELVGNEDMALRTHNQWILEQLASSDPSPSYNQGPCHLFSSPFRLKSLHMKDAPHLNSPSNAGVAGKLPVLNLKSETPVLTKSCLLHPR